MYGYVTIRLHNEYHYYAPRKLARVGPRLLPSTINGTVAEKEDRYRRTGACLWRVISVKIGSTSLAMECTRLIIL